MPTIDIIINNHKCHINDCTGDVLDDKVVAESLLLDSWSPDDVFSLLVSPDYSIWERDKETMISMRSEIESEMRKGIPFVKAMISIILKDI